MTEGDHCPDADEHDWVVDAVDFDHPDVVFEITHHRCRHCGYTEEI